MIHHMQGGMVLQLLHIHLFPRIMSNKLQTYLFHLQHLKYLRYSAWSICIDIYKVKLFFSYMIWKYPGNSVKLLIDDKMLNIYIYSEAPSILNTCSNCHLYGIYEFVQFMVYYIKLFILLVYYLVTLNAWKIFEMVLFRIRILCFSIFNFVSYKFLGLL